MALLKNIHLLADSVKQSDLDKMEHAALEHKRHSNITFKIVDLLPKKVVIQVVQEKSGNGHHFPQKRLIEIVHETFDRFFPGKKINVHAVPYYDSPANQVDVEWVNKKMLTTSTTIKDIARDTGIDYTQLSAIINGNRPVLSQPMKAMFWYYFLGK